MAKAESALDDLAGSQVWGVGSRGWYYLTALPHVLVKLEMIRDAQLPVPHSRLHDS
jgi:hypothetical protein